MNDIDTDIDSRFVSKTVLWKERFGELDARGRLIPVIQETELKFSLASLDEGLSFDDQLRGLNPLCQKRWVLQWMIER